LQFNALTELPVELAHCASLQVLALDHNRIGTIPVELCAGLTALRSWRMHNNDPLHVVPRQITEMPALTWMSLHECSLPLKITYFENCALRMTEIIERCEAKATTTTTTTTK
jgi:Leucine-rich repeat (LRR) protein